MSRRNTLAAKAARREERGSRKTQNPEEIFSQIVASVQAIVDKGW